MIRLLISICIIIGSVLFTSCNSCSSKKDSFDIPDSLTQGQDQPLEVSSEAMENIVQNIASPVEMAALIKSLGVPFNKDYVATTDNVDSYASSYTKAFNLGVFGADLGYINMYNKTTAVLEYISAIKTLADGVNVGQFFDFSTLKRLASNSSNLDSMMYISVHSFNKMDSYLRKNKRSNLSAIMIAGVWIEGLYLGTQVAKAHPTERLIQSIGEQKMIMSELMLILENYKQDKFIADLIVDIKVVKHEFDNIKITIEVGEPESVVKDGRLTIIQHEKSTANVTPEQMKEIIAKTELVRNKLINLK